MFPCYVCGTSVPQGYLTLVGWTDYVCPIFVCPICRKEDRIVFPIEKDDHPCNGKSYDEDYYSWTDCRGDSNGKM